MPIAKSTLRQMLDNLDEWGRLDAALREEREAAKTRLLKERLLTNKLAGMLDTARSMFKNGVEPDARLFDEWHQALVEHAARRG